MADVLRVGYNAIGEAVQGRDPIDYILNQQKLLDATDIAQGVLSLNQIAGTGLVLVDLFREGLTERGIRGIYDVMGQWLGRFTVPAGTLRDAYAAWQTFTQEIANPDAPVYAPPEMIARETEVTTPGLRALAPMFANVPGTLRELPERVSPIRAAPLMSAAPLTRQLTGLTYVYSTPVEQEFRRLHVTRRDFAPRTGDPDTDRMVTTIMGPIVEARLVNLLQSPFYTNLSPELQRAWLFGSRAAGKELIPYGGEIGRIRKQAIDIVFAALPALEIADRLRATEALMKTRLAESGHLGPLEEMVARTRRTLLKPAQQQLRHTVLKRLSEVLHED
jgi:hypothetical protein